MKNADPCCPRLIALIVCWLRNCLPNEWASWKPAFKENLASFYRYVSVTEGEIVLLENRFLSLWGVAHPVSQTTICLLHKIPPWPNTGLNGRLVYLSIELFTFLCPFFSLKEMTISSILHWSMQLKFLICEIHTHPLLFFYLFRPAAAPRGLGWGCTFLFQLHQFADYYSP